MAEKMKTTKKVMAGVLAGGLVVGGIAGGMVAYRKFSKKPVNVYNLADFSTDAMDFGSNTSMGQCSTKGIQKINVSDTQTITDVFVKEGQEVHVGDKLLAYDTTLTELDLKKAEITVEKAQLELEKAQKELCKLGSNTTEENPIVLAYNGSLNGTLLASSDVENEPSLGENESAGESAGKEDTSGENSSSEETSASGQEPGSEKVPSGTEKTTGDSTANSSESSGESIEGATESQNSESGTETSEKDIEKKDDDPDGELPGDKNGNTYLFRQDQQYALTEDNLKRLYDDAGESIILEVHENDRWEGALLASWGLLLSKDDSGKISVSLSYVQGKETITTTTTSETTTAITTDPTTTTTTDPTTTTTTDPTTTTTTDPTTTTTTKETTTTTTAEPTTETEETETEEIVPILDGDTGETWAEIQEKRSQLQDQIRDLTVTLKLAELDLKKKQAEFTDGVVYSKIDGVVKKVRDADEAFLNSEPIIEVSGGGGFYIDGAVSEWGIDDLYVGQMVSVIDYMNNTACTGTVYEISTTPATSEYSFVMDGSTNYKFTVFVDENQNLQNGDYCMLSYFTEGDSSNEWYLDSRFVRTEAGQSYVYALGENGTLEKRTITVGGVDDYGTKVKSGISRDDYLAFPYGDAVEGAKAKIADSSEFEND